MKLAAVGLHLVSWHSDPKPSTNNFNPGIYAKAECGAVVGTYYNSRSHQSFYAGYSFEGSVGRLEPFLLVGAVTGYKRSPVLPMITPGVGMRLTDRLSVRLAYLPGGFYGLQHKLHLALELKF
jgi:hypothetical protein